MIKNIVIKYADKVEVDTKREELIKTQIPIWLKEYAEEFNKQGGIVEITIGSDDRYNVSFDGISQELRDKIKIYQHPLRQPYNFR